MIDRWGIQHRYLDAMGVERTLSPDTVGRLRRRIGEPPGEPLVIVTRPARRYPVGRGVLRLEDGATLDVGDRLPADVPLGYHTFEDAAGTRRRVIVSPGLCAVPSRRVWGWTVQLFAARSQRSWGIGDLGDLADLAAWSAGAHGAGLLLVSPLPAVAPTLPQQASPYFPASRRFRNPLYLRIEAVPGAAHLHARLEPLAAAGRALNQTRLIDRDAVWRLKLAALEAIWAGAGGGADFDRWWEAALGPVRTFATWCALAETFGSNWHRWPARYQRPSGAAVHRFGAIHQARVRFHAWLQWLTQRQLGVVTERIAVMQDLPIGVDPDGADAWEWQDTFASGATIGAPPDEFNTQGQSWGLLPFVPWRLQQHDYQPFVESVRATIATGGGLRLDHALGLFRLWWIDDGSSPGGGGFVRYPADDLLDIVALESHRAGAVVVGEDLGTVEPGTREAMAAHRMLTYRVLWFEEDDPSRWPPTSMAAVTTHDLPTVGGLWTGRDLAEQERLGLRPNVRRVAAVRQRLGDQGGVAEGGSVSEAVGAAYRLLARAPSLLSVASLDDALGETERPNMPGADGLRPNWSLALPATLEQLRRRPLAGLVARCLARAADAAVPTGRRPPP